MQWYERIGRTKLIHLKNYTDDFFSFLLKSNNVNKPEVGALDEEKLQLLIDQANYCKIVFYNDDPAGSSL